MGCAAATAAHSASAPGAPRVASQPRPGAQAPTNPAAAGQQQQQQQQAGAYETMKTAPLVKSLVSVHREKLSLLRDDQGFHLVASIMAASAGEAVVYFKAEGASDTELLPLSASQVSRLSFPAGNAQELRLFITADELPGSLEEFVEEDGKHALVLDLQVDSAVPNTVTRQRSELKIPQEGDTVHVGKQWVQVGSTVRLLQALYGTLPNPKGRMEGTSSADLEGGECVICLSKPREVAILHCRHVCLCATCAKITSSSWSFQCPVCRGRVAAMVGLDELASVG